MKKILIAVSILLSFASTHVLAASPQIGEEKILPLYTRVLDWIQLIEAQKAVQAPASMVAELSEISIDRKESKIYLTYSLYNRSGRRTMIARAIVVESKFELIDSKTFWTLGPWKRSTSPGTGQNRAMIEPAFGKLLMDPRLGMYLGGVRNDFQELSVRFTSVRTTMKDTDVTVVLNFEMIPNDGSGLKAKGAGSITAHLKRGEGNPAMSETYRVVKIEHAKAYRFGYPKMKGRSKKRSKWANRIAKRGRSR